VPKKNKIRTDNLGRLMAYILGHRPDEFGLVPDAEGFVTYKEFLWALHEESGWGYVREGHIHEVLLGRDRALFQSEDKRIRALERRWSLDLENPSRVLPKILLCAIRRKSHPVVMEKGLRSIEDRHHILTPDRDMAMRIGRRRDQRPVVLEVMADAAEKKGTLFYPFGNLFLTTEIPAIFISGPPVSKEVIKAPKERPEQKEERPPDFEAGTFALDPTRDPDKSRRTRGKKTKGWKEEARKQRRKR
jgi:putative RNA 2'-phosphotransferase